MAGYHFVQKTKGRCSWRLGYLAICASLWLAFAGYSQAAQLAPKQLDPLFEQARQKWQVPGMAIAIIQDGKVIMEKGYGVREFKKSRTVDNHTRFAIASNSKAFTAASIAILVEEGKLNWDDRVIDQLPYFRLRDDYATKEMRIRDLLCHRSGLGTFSGDLIWWGTNYSAEETVRRVRFLEPASSFREKYNYSNVMYIAAGEVVRRRSGMPWTQFVQTKILDRLEMEETLTSASQLSRESNVATPHRSRDSKTIPLSWVNWENSAAAGGIISSVHDMSKWLQMQLNEGLYSQKRIFSQESSQTMWSPHTMIPLSKKRRETSPSTHFAAYGLGWSLKDYQGRKLIAHGGSYDGMYSAVVLVPEEKLGMVVLTNSMTELRWSLVYTVIDQALGIEGRNWIDEDFQEFRKSEQAKAAERAGKLRKRFYNTQPSLPLRAYTGRYSGEMYGDAKVKLERGKLVLKLLPNKDLVGELEHLQLDTFRVHWRKDFAWFDDGTVQFVFDSNGKVSEMKIDVPNGDMWFHELEFRRGTVENSKK